MSRTFGDIEAKIPKYGGNPNCVIAVPEIKALQITSDCDFIVIASKSARVLYFGNDKYYIGDGVFDTLTNREAIDSIWNSFNYFELAEDIHKQIAIGADAILQESINQGTSDNVTALIIAFPNLRRKLFPKKAKRTDNKENKGRIVSNPKIEEQVKVSSSRDVSNQSAMIPSQKASSLTDERALAEKKPQNIAVTATTATSDKNYQDRSPNILQRPKKIASLENIDIKKSEKILKISEPILTKSKPTESLAQTIAKRKLTANKLGTIITKSEGSEENFRIPVKASSLKEIK